MPLAIAALRGARHVGWRNQLLVIPAQASFLHWSPDGFYLHIRFPGAVQVRSKRPALMGSRTRKHEALTSLVRLILIPRRYRWYWGRSGTPGSYPSQERKHSLWAVVSKPVVPDVFEPEKELRIRLRLGPRRGSNMSGYARRVHRPWRIISIVCKLPSSAVGVGPPYGGRITPRTTPELSTCRVVNVLHSTDFIVATSVNPLAPGATTPKSQVHWLHADFRHLRTTGRVFRPAST